MNAHIDARNTSARLLALPASACARQLLDSNLDLLGLLLPRPSAAC
jgi:hypothetical protein